MASLPCLCPGNPPEPFKSYAQKMNPRVKPGGDTIDWATARSGLCLRGLIVVLVLFRLAHDDLGDHAGVLANRRLNLQGDIGIGLEEGLGVLAALPNALAVVGEPGAGFLHHAGLDAEIDEFAGLRYALAVHDVELDLLERRRQLVLHHLDSGLVADHLVALLDGADPADIEA